LIDNASTSNTGALLLGAGFEFIVQSLTGSQTTLLYSCAPSTTTTHLQRTYQHSTTNHTCCISNITRCWRDSHSDGMYSTASDSTVEYLIVLYNVSKPANTRPEKTMA
jgi:hypothetical protein